MIGGLCTLIGKKSIIGELYVSKEAFPSIKIPMKPIILDGTASYGF